MFAESSHFSTVPFPDVLSLDRVSINVNVFWFVNFFKKGIPFGKNLNLSEVFIFIFKRLMKKSNSFTLEIMDIEHERAFLQMWSC